MLVLLGNASARGLDGPRVTTVQVPDSYTPAESLATIVAADGVWANHAVPGTVPVWVESPDAGFATVLAVHYGCPVGRPDGWDGR